MRLSIAQSATTRLAARVGGEADVGEVAPRKQPRLGMAKDPAALLDDADERLVGIRGAVGLPERLVVHRAADRHVRGGEDAADELDRGDRELHGDPVDLLLDLGGVPVADRLERSHHADALRVVRVSARLATALA